MRSRSKKGSRWSRPVVGNGRVTIIPSPSSCGVARTSWLTERVGMTTQYNKGAFPAGAFNRKKKWPRDPLYPGAFLDALTSTRGHSRQICLSDSSRHCDTTQHVNICDSASVPNRFTSIDLSRPSRSSQHVDICDEAFVLRRGQDRFIDPHAQ